MVLGRAAALRVCTVNAQGNALPQAAGQERKCGGDMEAAEKWVDVPFTS